jgi:hypothetical protein
MRTDFDTRVEQNKKRLAVAYKQYTIVKRQLEHTENRLESLEAEELELNQARQDWDTQSAVDEGTRLQAEKEAVEAREAAEQKKQKPTRRKRK